MEWKTAGREGEKVDGEVRVRGAFGRGSRVKGVQ